MTRSCPSACHSQFIIPRFRLTGKASGRRSAGNSWFKKPQTIRTPQTENEKHENIAVFCVMLAYFAVKNAVKNDFFTFFAFFC
jgi:hypothetical protein